MLEIKEKNLDRREWYTDTDRDFTCLYYKDQNFDGALGLLNFTGLKAPDMVDSPSGSLCIADRGYQWLELAPKDENFVITVMFDHDKLFQQYVDITQKNVISENGDAVFYDMFLDVVFNENGEANVIDTEELEQALSEGIITNDEYELAKKTADRIVDFYRDNYAAIEKELFKYRDLICGNLKEEK